MHSPTPQKPNPQTKDSPLAARMRPRTLDEFIGQEHIIGPGRLLRRAIQADQLSSILLYGPPGTGKTTLAQIIANTTRARFLAINAVLAGVKDIREAIETAREVRKEANQKTILFVDEVHRFNKSQQDALLPHVENGTLTLIGATTENPYFEVNKALVSRSRIFQLKPLEAQHIRAAAMAALADAERGYGQIRVDLSPEALEHIVQVASGDARSALNALELAVETTPTGEDGIRRIGLDVAEESIQRRAVLYDKDGDSHYDTISAFIKSIRGSDADASLYWLSKMVYAGEDPGFIFRRMLILASEDVGLADPQALGIVSAAAQAFEYVGLPEGQFHLAQACLYLALAPKSNTTMAYYDALASVRSEQRDEVPDHLKDPSRDGEAMGHGKGYLYPHAYRDHWVAQQYLPTSLQGKVFYQPTDSGFEATLRERVARNREAQLEAAEYEKHGRNGPWSIGGGAGGVLGVGGAGGAEGSKAKPSTGSSRWLDRAASQSGEILSQVREGMFRLAQVKRESLVLDLSGGTGFLTWEACRLCPVGGVWSRCEDANKKQAMEEWTKHLETLARPELFTSGLDGLTEILGSKLERPKFDVILGLDLLRRTSNPLDLVLGLKPFSTPNTRFIWAEVNLVQSQGFYELIKDSKLSADLLGKVQNLQAVWRAERSGSELERLNRDLKVKGISTTLESHDFKVKKQFTPAQIQTWLAPEARARPDSLLAKLSQELSLRERSILEGALLDIFSGSGVPWRQSYDFMRVES